MPSEIREVEAGQELEGRAGLLSARSIDNQEFDDAPTGNRISGKPATSAVPAKRPA
jgi:hypothetical protein